MDWFANINEISRSLASLSVRVGNTREEIAPDTAFSQWAEFTANLKRDRGTVYIIGNGASASMASHISADLAKNAGVHTEVFSDLSLITAIGNDIGFEQVFAEPLRRRMNPGDMLVAISSSGGSPNIIRACRTAAHCGGVVVTLSAMKPDNAARKSGMLNFWVPAGSYGLAESCHAAILHHWVDRMTDAGAPQQRKPGGSIDKAEFTAELAAATR
jgi:D-sedoheptulose 7-phosphate isomerase